MRRAGKIAALNAFSIAASLLKRVRRTAYTTVSLAGMREAAGAIFRPMPTPTRPSGMSEEQWIDFRAACEGKITWAQYFARWGDNRLTL